MKAEVAIERKRARIEVIQRKVIDRLVIIETPFLSRRDVKFGS